MKMRFRILKNTLENLLLKINVIHHDNLSLYLSAAVLFNLVRTRKIIEQFCLIFLKMSLGCHKPLSAVVTVNLEDSVQTVSVDTRHVPHTRDVLQQNTANK